MLRPVIAALAALLLVACGGAPASITPSEGPAALDPAGSWQLVNGTVDGQPLPLDADAPVTLIVDGSGVSGESACNRYFGEFAVVDGRVTLRNLGGTEMACAEPVMALEAAYLAGLAKVDGAAIDGDVLVLTGPGVELQFERLPPPPTAVVVGTPWLLESVLQGDTVSSVVGEPATLTLHADGTLEGSTGCRTLTGAYTIEGDEFLATELRADGECPAEMADQDAHVVSVLGDGFRAALNGELLTVTGSGGNGLVYRPAVE
jgi:heat shock protein HslJ